MEHFHMALCFHFKSLVHRSLLDENRYSAIKDINLLMGISDHASGNKKTPKADNDTTCQKQAGNNQHQLYLVF